MATFLQLVNTCRQEAGVATSDLTTLQSGLSQESTNFKSWVAREWYRVQAQRAQWQFMRVSAEFLTTTNQALYTVAQVGAAATPTFASSRFANWILPSFRFYTDPLYSDEMMGSFLPWDQWRNLYQYGNNRNNSSRPVTFTVTPDKSLGLGMKPDGVYHVVFEYYAAPVTMTADTDTPTMPAEHHDLIVYRALKAYGVFMAAPEVIARAEEEIRRIQPMLMADQLPVMTSGRPLA